MIVSLGAMVLGSLVIGVGSLLAVNGMHQDMGVTVRGYRQLRQLFDVGFLVSRARDAISTNPPQPAAAIAALQSATTKLDERSDVSAVEGPPAAWVDESARRNCRDLIHRSIEQLSEGSGGTAALNLTFSQLSRVADQVRIAIADAQHAADRRQRLAQTSIVALDVCAVAFALLVGVWQYRRVINPIRQLTAGVRAFTAGHLDQQLSLRGDQEFVALAADFNKMARELSALYRELEAKVAAKSQQLVRSEQLASVGYLAASVAHEINNPLGIIAGYGERAMQRLQEANSAELSSQTLATLKVICEEAFRCKQITDRLLSLARPGSNQRSEFSLGKLAETVVGTLTGLGPDQGRQLSLDCAPECDLQVLANEGELKQLLLNLVMNAMDAVDPVTGKIVVSLKREGEAVVLRVSDNGVGMTAETLEHIFEPFYTEKRGQRRGTGLGLSIAQTIAVEHGGSIEASSAGVQQGSAFTVKIPVARPD
jgi:signal transduction histidine kinase